MGPTRCPESSVNNYHTTTRNIPEERKSQKIISLWISIGIYKYCLLWHNSMVIGNDAWEEISASLIREVQEIITFIIFKGATNVESTRFHVQKDR
jgi:hypothetical protein